MLTTPVQPVLGTRTRGTRVSSSPSKIPYGEFSPVRLQTGIQPRPSPTRSGSNRHPAPAYTRLKSRSRERATSRCRPCSQSALSPSDRTLPSRGPWLASGFCCPARSTLTMTSSETLDPSRRLMFSPSGRPWAERFPNLLCLSVSSVPSSVPRQTGRLHLAVPSSSALAFPISVVGRHLHSPRVPVPAWLCNGGCKVRFMLRPGRIASPAPARAFTFELSPPESPHEGVEYNYAGKSANSRGRTCTGRTSSIMGCELRRSGSRKLSPKLRSASPMSSRSMRRAR